jgi:hypothetical protein
MQMNHEPTIDHSRGSSHSRWFWFGFGVLFWGILWWVGASVLGIHATGSALTDVAFYLVTTLVLTVAFQDLINGFPSNWPPQLWFFFPLAALLVTAISFSFTFDQK